MGKGGSELSPPGRPPSACYLLTSAKRHQGWRTAAANDVGVVHDLAQRGNVLLGQVHVVGTQRLFNALSAGRAWDRDDSIDGEEPGQDELSVRDALLLGELADLVDNLELSASEPCRQASPHVLVEDVGLEAIEVAAHVVLRQVVVRSDATGQEALAERLDASARRAGAGRTL